MDKTDEELIERYLSGEQDSLKILIERYSPMIYNFSARVGGVYNAPDITQDVFIKVWKNLKKFDLDRASFKTWIFTIARNTTFDYLKKKKNLVFSDVVGDKNNFEENIVDKEILPSEAIQKIQDKQFLDSLLDKLSENYREVLVLYYQEEMTFAEIAQILDKSLNTVKSQHRRALIKLREEIKIK